MRLPKLIMLPLVAYAIVGMTSSGIHYVRSHWLADDAVIPCSVRSDDDAREKFLLNLKGGNADVGTYLYVIANSGFEVEAVDQGRRQYGIDGNAVDTRLRIISRQISVGYCWTDMFSMDDPDVLVLYFDRNLNLIRAF